MIDTPAHGKTKMQSDLNTGPAMDIAEETRRIESRREWTGLSFPESIDEGRIGLALSGGGIRSATFSLGVMQALSLADAPVPEQTFTNDEHSSVESQKPVTSPNEGSTGTRTSPRSWLHLFDYLSTVSGGGYIGAFFTSLFVEKRYLPAGRSTLSPEMPAETAAKREAAAIAYESLTYAPPGRIVRGEMYDAVGSGPLAWLRDNGRYLSPSSGGDMAYALALTIRNWFAIHYVIGSLALLGFALLGVLRIVAAKWFPWFELAEAQLLCSAVCRETPIWWSSTWLLPVFICLVWIIPAGAAFWLTYPKSNQTAESVAQPLNFPAALNLISVAVFAFAAYRYGPVLDADGRWFDVLAWATTGLLALSFALYAGPLIIKRRTITEHRVWLTRVLMRGMLLFLAFVAIAVIDTAAQSLYLLLNHGHLGWSLGVSAFVGAVTALFRRIAAMSNKKAMPSWISRLPIGFIAGFAGIILLAAIMIVWDTLAIWISWHGMPLRSDSISATERLLQIGVAAAIFLLIALVNGRFSGFVNLSTLQSLYSARLIRAYLGASNGNRFAAAQTNRKAASAAEPVPGDGVDHETYYKNDLAPVHIINITMNQTVDPSEQLTQRDRKGRPMAVLPRGFTVGSKYHPFGFADGDDPLPMTIGQWIGISGAAVSTGLGRATSLGTSLALGLANVRLGLWWPSLSRSDRLELPRQWLGRIFRTQQYLYYEMTARFFGRNREWQYLSDGGHFENTAVYELLREERNCRVIVVCDNGADPNYEFGDVAGLIRLARIDYRLHIELDERICNHETLGKVFGSPSDFTKKRASNEPDDVCAMMYDVRSCTPNESRILAKMIVVKPCIVSFAPTDVLQYALTHDTFPNETTADQFFDEAQWESYRQLGFVIGHRLFGGQSNGVGRDLWQYLIASLNEGT